MRLLRTVAATVAALTSCVCLATASPADVIADYRADGVIDGTYSLSDLNGALKLAYRTRSASYGAQADAIRAAQDEVLAGVHRGDAPMRKDGGGGSGDGPKSSSARGDVPVDDGGGGPATPANPGGSGAPAPAATDTPVDGAPVTDAPEDLTADASPVASATPAAISAAELPSPPVAQPDDRVPWPFITLAVLAGGLVVAGLGAGLLRRTRHGRG